MKNTKAERITAFMLMFVSIVFIAVSVAKGWEFWLPFIIGPMAVGTVVLHFMQGLTESMRWNVYFWYTAMLVFLYTAHGMSQTHITLIFILFLSIFSLSERLYMLSLIMIELLLAFGVNVYLMYRDDPVTINATFFVSIAINSTLVFLVFLFSRSLVKNRIEMKNELKMKEEALSANDEDMEDFLSNISHELRTPINVISGMTSILMKDVDRDELQSIKMAGIRLAQQVEDVQDYTEIKQGGLVLEEEKYMTTSLINDLISEYRVSERNNDFNLVVDIDPEIPTMLAGDEKKIKKMIRHMLDNAVKFTERGGAYIRIYKAPRDYGINLIVEVTDTGVGMTRKEMSFVTKGMYQANKKRDRSTGGIGLGLPIIYGFAHKMGGFVTIESGKNSGTTVRLSVPQEVVDPNPCLTLKPDYEGCIVFYNRQNKYSVPEVRDFYRLMATNLASALHIRLYSASEIKELEKLLDELPVTHVFMGVEEYDAESEYFESLSKKGYSVISSTNNMERIPKDSNVTWVNRPLYGIQIVNLINTATEFGDDDKEEKFSLTGVSALVVDDEPMNLVVATGLFKEYKMFTDTAESGQKALEKYTKEDYDVIFMDHMMPGMDGVETMKHIREIAIETERSPIIIALTANALSGVREMFKKEGFDGFIAKPIDIKEFEHVMKNTLPESMIRYEGRDSV